MKHRFGKNSCIFHTHKSFFNKRLARNTIWMFGFIARVNAKKISVTASFTPSIKNGHGFISKCMSHNLYFMRRAGCSAK